MDNKTNKDVCEFVAARIRYERNRRGYTQKSFALKVGIPLRTYKRFELSGKGTISTFIEILRALERLVLLEFLLPGIAKEGPSLEDQVNKIRDQQRKRLFP